LDLVEFLREHCGSSTFEHGSPVFPRLLESQPQRVIITRLGRIEVYQAIGGEHTDDKTPEGPHTHLLPELLGLNLTHSADVPIKEGWVPCAFLYPKSPVLSEAGEAHRDS
jgi:sulfite exporter TauE/SafE